VLLVLRHGATLWNAPPKRCQGQLDVSLSRAGRAAAREIGPTLLRFDAAYASHLARARETAELLLGATGTPLALDRRLAEADCGSWQGELLDDLRRRFPDAWRAMAADDPLFRFPEGEAFAEVLARFAEALDELDARHANGAALVVAHGGPMRLYLKQRGLIGSAVVGGPPDNLQGFRLATDVADLFSPFAPFAPRLA
jgi:2,3-bisphosphoglycerate-dependent phosphoglycerate mutase